MTAAKIGRARGRRRSSAGGPIDFDRINRAALARLPDLLARWLPGGRMEGREYVVSANIIRGLPRRSENSGRRAGCAISSKPTPKNTTITDCFAARAASSAHSLKSTSPRSTRSTRVKGEEGRSGVRRA
jgi:hypothetical protein